MMHNRRLSPTQTSALWHPKPVESFRMKCIQRSRFGAWGVGCSVQGLGFRDYSLGLRVDVVRTRGVSWHTSEDRIHLDLHEGI